VIEVFGGRKTKKQLDDLKEEHHDLEERFDTLQDRHEKLQHEAGEQTNMRISHIEEEIESMNQRVEKLANDSYEIRGEVRDIHESVLGMQTSLSEIVKLYKAIITQYGFGDMKGKRPQGPAKKKRQPGDDPGDAIIRALEEEQSRDRRAPASEASASPKPGAEARSRIAASPPPPPPRPAPSNADPLDELHRLSEAHKERANVGEMDVASVMTSRSGREDKVDRVARRDLDRPDASDMDREGDFTRSLPKKDLRPKANGGANNAGKGDGWEAMHPPAAQESRARRPKPKLEDLLNPE